MLLNKRISIADFLSTIKYDILLITAYAIAIGYLDRYGVFNDVSIPIGVTSVFGTAVALLLGFRTNQSYDRWWEARSVWGAIVNDSRSLVRQALLFYKRDHPLFEEKIKRIAQRQIIWCYALGEALRKLPFSERVNSFIEKEEIPASQNIPNAILLEHAKDISNALDEKLINEFQQVQMDTTIVRLCDSMGKCERIKNTVFPRAHSMLIHTIIYVFATMLPFGLPDDFPWVEIVLTIVIPVIFIAIEKTSILMQDPFENKPMDTPVTDLAQTIEINIKQMIGDRDIPKKSVPETYYVL
jgi:putative membrane protein